MSPRCIRIHPADDVVIARRQLLGGTRARRAKASPWPAWCRPATRSPCAPSRAGEPVRRYNQIIGIATQAHRARPARAHAQPGVQPASRATTRRAPARTPTAYVADAGHLQGIVRADGRVATRNYIGVLTSVNCSATAARAIADHFRRDIHPRGAGRLPERRRRGRADARHRLRARTATASRCRCCAARSAATRATPTSPRVLVVGLGCEANQISGLMRAGRPAAKARSCAPSTSRTPAARAKTVARRHRAGQGDAAPRPTACSASRCRPATSPSACNAAARDGYSRHQRQPGAGRGGRPAGAPRRHGDPVAKRPRSTAASTC